MTQRHENYEILNLVGYGLAKFEKDFVKEFGFATKSAFFQFLISKGVSKTVGTIKNRQDMFDYFFDNGRKGWWQKGDTYIHRKLLIDSLFGTETAESYANVVKIYLQQNFRVTEFQNTFKPITQSKFRQIQETGREAEVYFLNNYQLISGFENGSVEDARLFGDGYDFQLDFPNQSYNLIEVKGVKIDVGNIRFTEKEFYKAEEFGDKYFLVIVSNLINSPRFSVIGNPIENLRLKRQERIQKPAIEYISESIKWRNF